MNLVQKLWMDEAAVVISAELVLEATILILGMIVGMATLRDHVVQELADVAGAVGDLVQSYSFSAITGHNSSTAGSDFLDLPDLCDVVANNDLDGSGAQCVDVAQSAVEE